MVRRGEPAVGRAADLPDDVRALPTVGRGPQLYPEALTQGRALLDVSAGALATLVAARLAAGEAVDEQEALYLRRPDAVPSAARA